MTVGLSRGTRLLRLLLTSRTVGCYKMTQKSLKKSSCGTESSLHLLKDDGNHRVYLHPAPFSPGTTVVATKKSESTGGLLGLAIDDFVHLFLEARRAAHLLNAKLPVSRCALVSDCGPGESARLKVIPLHGLNPEWQPIVHSVEEFHTRYPGYISSHNGPRMPDEELTAIQNRIRSCEPSSALEVSHRFDGDPNDSNLFARIIRGELPQWRVWEDDCHVAFLTPFPNTPGFTVLVPRRHLPSDLFSLSEEDYVRLMNATYTVGQLLCRSLPADSCGVIFEGYEIDYAHVKLLPIVRSGDEVVGDCVPSTDFCDIYKGYVTSVDGPNCSSDDLFKLHTSLTVQ